MLSTVFNSAWLCNTCHISLGTRACRHHAWMPLHLVFCRSSSMLITLVMEHLSAYLKFKFLKLLNRSRYIETIHV